MTSSPAPLVRPTRIRVFVDFWNFQLTFNERAAADHGAGYKTSVDFQKLGPWLAERAAAVVLAASEPHSFEGMTVYLSFDPRKESDKKFVQWATNWLAKQAGVNVEIRDRKPKGAPKCPDCHKEIADCPHCKKRMHPSGEKGVDTLIATDMIRLAWEDAYDVAVLATSDRDLIPCAEFLRSKGLKVVHAAFPPKGSDLSRASWAHFDIYAGSSAIERAPKAGIK